jgi:hypothetical protein
MKAKKSGKPVYSIEIQSENRSRNVSPVDGLVAGPLVPLPVVQLEQAAAAVQPVAAAALQPVAAAALQPVAAAALQPVAAAALQPVAVAQNNGLHEAYRQYYCQQQPARYGNYYQQ